MQSAPINGVNMYGQPAGGRNQQGANMYGQPMQGNRQQAPNMYGQPKQGNRQQAPSMYGQPMQGNRQQAPSMYGQPIQGNRQQAPSMYGQPAQKSKQQGGNQHTQGGQPGNNNQKNSNPNNNRNKFTKNFNDNDDKTNTESGNSFDYALFPKVDSQDLINFINSKISQDDFIIQKSSIQDEKYPYLRISVPRQIEKKLLDLTGTPLRDQKVYYFSSIPNKNEDKIVNAIFSNFNTQILDDERLNLSNISNRFGIPGPQRFSTSFILFLCAVECFSQELNIKEINYEDNSQTDTKGFANILALFPFLERVYLAGNNFGNRDKDIYKPFNPPQDSDRKRVDVVLRDHAKPNVIKDIQLASKPYLIHQKPIIKTNKILSKRPKLNLGNFIPVSINPNDSEIHRFILAFIDRGWKDLKNIHEFYVDESIFTLTADICPDKSPLHDNFIKKGYSRDLLDDSEGIVIVGARNIAEAQFDIFGGGFYSTLNSYDFNILNDEMCAVVCHGAFQININNKDVWDTFCFDRSFFIGSNGEHIFITNDHIFIRKAKLPGMI